VTSPITSVPIQKAIVIITTYTVIVIVTKLETIANGTAFAALLASSARRTALKARDNPYWVQKAHHERPSIVCPEPSVAEVCEHETS
jgi:hypothetical protein